MFFFLSHCMKKMKRLIRMDKFTKIMKKNIRSKNPAYKAMQENKLKEHGYSLDDFIIGDDIDPFTWDKIPPIKKRVEKQKGFYVRGDLADKLIIPKH